MIRHSHSWVLAGLLGLLAAGCAPKIDDSVIRIGEYDALTGDTATFGQTTHEGIVMAVEQINAAGGIKGKKVVLITEDDQGKPEQAALVAEKLLTEDQVHALIGEVASSNSLAVAPIAQRAQIPMISPSSTNAKVTEQGDFIFRVCFIDSFQGKVAAKFAFNSLKARTAAVFRDEKSDYSLGLADVFTREFEAAGGKIVADKAYMGGDVDFKAQLTSLRDAKPDLIYVPGYYSEVGLIARQARAIGLKQPLLGGDGWESEELYKIGGAALENCYFTNHCAPDSPDKVVRDFVAAYEARWKHEPGALAMLGYDAVNVLAAAIARAPDLRGPSLRDALAATKDFPGVTGSISMDADRNAVKSAVILQIKGGRAVYKETVAP
ncbi:MAG TPA: ABC transporter substrate-binding protein [bacterium]|jgi:branched-chain amino acid transport system substrate-binding protein|nr:ABC transporter substrate-binding protein [bacterium]